MPSPLFSYRPDEETPSRPACPFCSGTRTRVISPFGGQLSVAQCWCDSCRTGFEYIKWEDQADSPLDRPTG